MAESQSETSSEVEDLKKEIQELRSNLDWSSALLAVLLQEAGGAVEVSKSDLESVKLNEVMARIVYQEETETFLVEGVFYDQS